MNGLEITFSNTEIEKHKFHYHKNPILIDDIDVNEVILSDKAFFRRKRF